MAWVQFEGKLYRLPLAMRFSQAKFRVFQERNRSRDVLIYAPEGECRRVPMPELRYEGEEADLLDGSINDTAVDLGVFALDLEFKEAGALLRIQETCSS